jgi:hypothetical protein
VHGGDFYATDPSDANAGLDTSEHQLGHRSGEEHLHQPVTLGAVTSGATYSLDVTRLIAATSSTVTSVSPAPTAPATYSSSGARGATAPNLVPTSNG